MILLLFLVDCEPHAARGGGGGGGGVRELFLSQPTKYVARHLCARINKTN